MRFEMLNTMGDDCVVMMISSLVVFFLHNLCFNVMEEFSLGKNFWHSNYRQ